jgi:hypothetical protein
VAALLDRADLLSLELANVIAQLQENLPHDRAAQAEFRAILKALR